MRGSELLAEIYMSKRRLDAYNTLPPKPEYTRKVKAALSKGSPVSLAALVAGTGLSRTQALCALDPMVKSGAVVKEENSMVFRLANSNGVVA